MSPRVVNGSLLESGGGFKSFRTAVDRFWSFVERTDDRSACWLWRGTTVRSPSTGNRYGRFRLDSAKKVLAHRFAFMLERGEVGAMDDVHHDRCRETLCCNPWHLERITKVDHGKMHGPEARLPEDEDIAVTDPVEEPVEAPAT